MDREGALKDLVECFSRNVVTRQDLKRKAIRAYEVFNKYEDLVGITWQDFIYDLWVTDYDVRSVREKYVLELAHTPELLDPADRALLETLDPSDLSEDMVSLDEAFEEVGLRDSFE
jgi:hypothetical protein